MKAIKLKDITMYFLAYKIEKIWAKDISIKFLGSLLYMLTIIP